MTTKNDKSGQRRHERRKKAHHCTESHRDGAVGNRSPHALFDDEERDAIPNAFGTQRRCCRMSTFKKPFVLPDHWNWAVLSDLCTKITDGTHSSPKEQFSEPAPDRFRYVTSKNVRQDGLKLDDISYLKEEDHKRIYSGCPVEKGDILLIKDGVNTGIATVNQLEEEFSLLSSVALLKPKHEHITSRFLKHFLNSPVGFELITGEMTGSAIRRIVLGRIKETPIPLPPLSEQRRIVAKIEELFSNLDAGMDDLQAAGQQLERYRLSVLQAAVEGCLTADWRHVHDPEPADQLLERILEERREQWEEDYRAKYRKKDRDLPSGWKSRYSEAEEPETEELGELPKGWTWTSLDQLLSNMRNGYSKAPKAEDGLPILRISSVRPLSVDLDDVRYLDGEPGDYEKYLVEPGYLLFIRYNGNPGLVGACAAVPDLDQPYAHPDKLIRGEVADHETVMPRYLEIALNIGPSREHIQNR